MQQHFSLRNHWCSRGLALLLVLILGIGLARPALAATTIIADQASCEAFGGKWSSLYGCQKFSTTVATGDTLTLQVISDFYEVTNNGTFELQSFLLVSELTNNSGATINVSGRLDLGSGFHNAGVMNITGTVIVFDDMATNASTGQIYVRNGATLSLSRGGITNEGVIRVECGGAIVYGGFTISGNPPQDLCPPSVTVNQAAGQADPTNRNPVLFTANFGQAVTDFTAVDIILGGTADRSGAAITVSGGPSSYTISVNGINGNGTVTVAVPANAVTDAEGQRNPASSSTDNSITYLADFTPPVAAPSPSLIANANGWNNRDVTVDWQWSDSNGLDPANCTPSSTSRGEGTIDLTATCQDVVANIGHAQYRVRVDKSRPTGNPTQVPSANSNGWNNRDVTVAWRWADSGGSNLDLATCPPATLVSQEGRTDLTQICFDRAGNEMRSVYTVNLDKTPPTTNPTQSPAANANGWHNSDVTVTWNWRDPATSPGPAAGLDPANCPATTTSSGEGSRTLNSDCADLAANRANQSYTVNVDKTAPVVTVTGAIDLADNNTAPVSVSYTVNAPTPTNTAIPPTATNTNTPVPPTATPTYTPVPPTATATNTVVPPTATNTPVPPTATPTAQATLPANLYTTVQQVRSNLAALLPSGGRKADQALQKAIAKLDQGLSPVFWQVPDGNQLSNQGEKAFHRLRDATKELCKLKPPPAAVTVTIDTLTGVGRTLAEQAISAATTAGGNAKQLTKAIKEMSKAQQDLAKQRPDLAFSHYEEAWEAAQAAIGVVLAAAEPEDAPLDEDTADADHVHAADAAESHADRQINQLFLPLINR